MRMAVVGSTRSIPIPPYLPGYVPQVIAGAPLLPGQQPIIQSGLEIHSYPPFISPPAAQ